jgi:hypothetical protein
LISFGISFVKTTFNNYKMIILSFTDFYTAKVRVATRIRHSFSSYRQSWFFFLMLFSLNIENKKINLKTNYASSKLKELDEKKYDLWNMWINWIIRQNLTLICIFWYVLYYTFFTKFSKLQMMHGCRSDLILKYLVNSNKDRNFFSLLLTNKKLVSILSTLWI